MTKLNDLSKAKVLVLNGLFITSLVISGCVDEQVQLTNSPSSQTVVNQEAANLATGSEINGNYLQSLNVVGLAISPTFELTSKHYVTTAAFDVKSISLEALARNFDDKVYVNGYQLKGSGDYNLAVGNNLFTIVVITEEGSSEQYQLTVTRLSSYKA